MSTVMFRPVQLTSADDILFVRKLRSITNSDDSLIRSEIARVQAIHTNFAAIGEANGERAAYVMIGMPNAQAEFGRGWIILVAPAFRYSDIKLGENLIDWAMQSLSSVKVVFGAKDWIKAACLAADPVVVGVKQYRRKYRWKKDLKL